MTEYDKEILEESTKTIERLYALNVFFEEPAILKIYLQTQVIHQLFAENADLDTSKLELFHIQYTTTLIELLDKIRTKNERLVGMYESEIKLNEDMIVELRTAIAHEGGFDVEKHQQEKRISRAIYNLHKALSARFEEYPFEENINAFSIKFYKDHFFEADAALLPGITGYQPSDVYRNRFAVIGKDVLTTLAKGHYKISFFAGVKLGHTLIEIYKTRSEDKYFLFLPSKNNFLPCDIHLFPYREWEAEGSKKERSIKSLMQKNIELERAVKHNLRHIDSDIIALLNENHKKISEVDFLEDLENIDIQANTLKAMLETKMI